MRDLRDSRDFIIRRRSRFRSRTFNNSGSLKCTLVYSHVFSHKTVDFFFCKSNFSIWHIPDYCLQNSSVGIRNFRKNLIVFFFNLHCFSKIKLKIFILINFQVFQFEIFHKVIKTPLWGPETNAVFDIFPKDIFYSTRISSQNIG